MTRRALQPNANDMATITTTGSHHARLRAQAVVAVVGGVMAAAVAAALVMPHLPTNAQAARTALAEARLSALRNAADLYYHQHHHRYPGEYAPADGRTRFHQGQESQAAAAFIAQLTRYSDATGRTSTRKTAAYRLGPYIPSQRLPDNPLMRGGAADKVEIDFTLALPYTVYPPDGRSGWRYYLKTGRLAANDNARINRRIPIDYQ